MTSTSSSPTPSSGQPAKQGLYDPWFEHDACGVGFVVDMQGRKSHQILKAGHRGLDESRPPRRLRLRGQHRRRRRRAAADAAQVLPAGGLQEGAHHAARRRRVRLRHDLPAAQPDRQAPQDRAVLRADRAVRGPGRSSAGARCRPTTRSLGETAKSCEPFMRQVIIGRGAGVLTKASSASSTSSASAPTARSAPPRWTAPSSGMWPASRRKTIVYKGMLLTDQLGEYFPDLTNPAMETAIGLVHSRFSTNTFPSWDRAHPYRYVAHNGEINTLRGNINWMHAREALFESRALRRRHQEDPAHRQPERQRLGDVRQRARAARARRPLAAARGHDDDPGAVVERPAHGRRAPRVLPVPRQPHGTLGRPGRHRLHRRHADRRHPRPQRPASLALTT
jgi:glutamate synthase domain-containing protein 1